MDGSWIIGDALVAASVVKKGHDALAPWGTRRSMLSALPAIARLLKSFFRSRGFLGKEKIGKEGNSANLHNTKKAYKAFS